MCGICGVINYNSTPVSRETLKKMSSKLIHRGPDEEGYYLSSPTENTPQTGLAIRRLKIIDLDHGSQPIYNEDKNLVIVFNGEIYNFLELRERLEAKHKFSTKADTEVIIHLYEEYGENCVNHLRGMFAFAIWDIKNKKLFIAKDRIGKKPLYYINTGTAFVFASEIKSILEYLNKTPEIDLKSINSFLTYQYIPSPDTIFKNIKSLMPAHVLTCDKKGNIAERKYWNIDFSNKTILSFKDACEETRNILTEATRIRMISDVPLGAFLSGGHDSSIIVGLMSQLSSKPVKTFSIGFEESDFSELKYAKVVADHFGTEHHEFTVKPDFIDILPKLVWHYGQPFADPSALPSYFVANETKKSVTVALNGDGGDETFGGYLRYKALKASLYLGFPFQLLGKKITGKLADLIPFAGTAKGKNIFNYIRRFMDGLSSQPYIRNAQWHSCFTPEELKRLYFDKMQKYLYNDAYSYLSEIFKYAPAETMLDRAIYTDLKTYLPECLLVKMDIASMANSLEARSPFLDHKMLEFSASLPPNWKINGLTSKYILKKTFKDFLPEEILNRGKQGFGIPVGKWFRTSWKNYFRENVLSKKALSRGYFKKEPLEQMFDEHVAGKRDHGNRLWALLMLEVWHKVYIDGNSKYLRG